MSNSAGIEIICEADFRDGGRGYSTEVILRWDSSSSCYDLYEIINAENITDRFIQDATFQAYMLRKLGSLWAG